MNTKLASGLTAITWCLFLIGCEQKVSDPWPEILTKSVDDINVCLDAQVAPLMKFEFPMLTVYETQVYKAEVVFDITSVTLNRSLAVPFSGFNLLSFKCKNDEEACITRKILERDYESTNNIPVTITNWREDCSMMEAINANRGVYNLIEYSEMKDKEPAPVQ